MFCLTALQAVCSVSLITRKGLKKGTTKQNNAYSMFNMFFDFGRGGGEGGRSMVSLSK